MAVWNYKTVVVYEIESHDSRMLIELAGSFKSSACLVCLFGLAAYTVESDRIYVRNFQVGVAAALSSE